MQVKRAEAPVDVRFVIKHRQEESGLEQRDLAAGAEVPTFPVAAPKSTTRSFRNWLTSSVGELSNSARKNSAGGLVSAYDKMTRFGEPFVSRFRIVESYG